MTPDVAALPPFAPVRCLDGYLPIEDHGLIGDGMTAALVGRDGAVSWLCLPRFDSDPVFCALLDRARGGGLRVDVDGLKEARQYYLPDSAVLVTELRSASGLLRVTDLLPLREGADLAVAAPAGTGCLLRLLEVLDGEVGVTVAVTPRQRVTLGRGNGGARLVLEGRPGLDLSLVSTLPLEGLSGRAELRQGERAALCLSWQGPATVDDPEGGVRRTVDAWRRWLASFSYEGPGQALVRRSAITIKLLDYLPNGAMVAAPTTSLPERIGGERNWDYRFVWVRDASFSVYALRRIGFAREAEEFLLWVLGLAKDEHLRVMYTLDGTRPGPERIDPALEGYRRSPPVRWGNAAADQVQHDVYGEILDCAFQWANHGGRLTDELWGDLRRFVERARRVWDQPDQGIWEVRSAGRVQTYSAGICQVALDRGARLATRFGLDGDVAGWRTVAGRIQRRILEDAWNEEGQFLGQGLGSGHLDAALLALPLRRVVPARHPRMVATVEAIQAQLGAGNGLLYRYRPKLAPDGLTGDEGAFVLCSFWLVDNLALQGRLDEAHALYETMCNRTNALGLLPEEIDPASGRFLGNFPQAFSHIGLVSSAVNLHRAEVALREGRERVFGYEGGAEDAPSAGVSRAR